jgi:Recombination endonuclease VII
MPTEVPPPKSTTLKKYGISQEEWSEIARQQGGVCPICGKLPENGRLVTDHEHIRGYKKMPTCNRKTYIRGLPCIRCNLMYLPIGISVEKAKNIVRYLEAYEQKKLEILSKSMPSSVLPTN